MADSTLQVFVAAFGDEKQAAAALQDFRAMDREGSIELIDAVVVVRDLEEVVDAALQELDLTKIVMDRVDLVTVAEYVVAAIDLPEIIRASTGSMASETVRGLRMPGVGADQAVTRAVDKVLFRRAHRRAAADALPRQGTRAENPEDGP